MADIKSSSRSGSKANLNEAAIPLLDEEETKNEKVEIQEKDTVELKETASSEAEKDDSHPEKTKEVAEKSADDSADKKEEEKKKKEHEKKEKEEKKKKDKEEKKKKEEEKQKEKEEKKKKEQEEKEEKRRQQRQRAEKVVQKLTVGLNLLDRDEKHVNDAINLNFDDILAEPDAAHGFDGIWRGSFIVFTGTRYWIYRILAALLAIPLSIVWGVVFSLLTFFSIWLATPVLRVLDVALFYVRRVWSGLVHTTLEPLAAAASVLLANVRVTHNNTAATHIV